MGNYIAIDEPSSDHHRWWITFATLPGVLLPRTLRAVGTKMPLPIDQAGVTVFDLDDYNKPLVLLISVDRASGGDARPGPTAAPPGADSAAVDPPAGGGGDLVRAHALRHWHEARS
jgi:hypothetical protein